MSKIKLSPEQEAFAREIGATHYDVRTKIFHKTHPYLMLFNDFGGEWVESSFFPEDKPDSILEIDFTAAQEPDWKAVAQDLILAMHKIVLYSKIDDAAVYINFDMRNIAEAAIQRAKEAGL